MASKLEISPLTVLLILVGGYAAVRLVKGNLLNPFSDQNVAYQGVDKVVKAAFGDKATLTDVIPGINRTNATTTAPSRTLQKLSVLPSKAAPFWYNADRTKRTAPMTRGGTVYNAFGQMLQITDTATQAAAKVTALANVE